MSRYILTHKSGDSEVDSSDNFVLVPTEGLGEREKSIELPKNLVPRLSESKKETELDKLMMKLSKANIGRSKDGLVTVGSRVMKIKFDDFVLDSSIGKFYDFYEELYCILRKNGITF